MDEQASGTGTGLFGEPVGAGGAELIALRIVPSRREKLTPDQRTFNRLTKQIETLQADIRGETARLDRLLKAYAGSIPDLLKQAARAKLDLAKAMGASMKAIKYGKRQAEHVRDAIFVLCDEAFTTVVPDEPTQAFFKEWSNRDYHEELRDQRRAMQEDLSDMARAAWGMDIDFTQMGETPEEMARFASQVRERVMAKAEAQAGPRGGERRKSSKQRAREQREQQQQAEQLKTVRGLYLSLAKALHPDTETDPDKKAQKEDLMRRVTAAYAGKDMAALLRLEMEWLVQARHNLASLSQAKLKVYIASLREQVTELEMKRMELLRHPRYQPILDVAWMPEAEAKAQLTARAALIRELLRDLAEVTAMCEDRKLKAQVARFAEAYVASSRAARSASLDDLDDLDDLDPYVTFR